MPDGFSRQPTTSVAQDALAGLTALRKTLPAKLFYDAEGCRLFGQITELPEYYLTRTEMRLLQDIAGAISDIGPNDGVLVEYGASREDKAAILLRAFAAGGKAFRAYVPIDVAAEALSDLASRMSVTHPKLTVHPLAADFLSALTLPRQVATSEAFGFFPGSTIGNLEPQAATAFLQQARQTLGEGAQFLVGADLRKDPAILLPAYDDAAGVTAAFNRNLLVRLNREAAANFDLNAFAHCAIWNDAESRIEMHLVSLQRQTVRVAGRDIVFAKGETIHTENSYKHSLDHFAAIAEAGGWNTLRVWTDSQRLFSLHLLATG
jgi:dimethylhistidine N-methyltransferase